MSFVIGTLCLFIANKIYLYCPTYELFSVHRICTPQWHASLSDIWKAFNTLTYQVPTVSVSVSSSNFLRGSELIPRLEIKVPSVLLYLECEAQNLVFPTSFGLQNTVKPLNFLFIVMYLLHHTLKWKHCKGCLDVTDNCGSINNLWTAYLSCGSPTVGRWYVHTLHTTAKWSLKTPQKL